jgi:hypothetical protein
MDAVAIAFLTLLAMLVGMLMVIALQLHQSLKRLEGEVREARNQVGPLIARLNNASNLASGVALAVAAGVRAYRESSNHSTPTKEEALR